MYGPLRRYGPGDLLPRLSSTRPHGSPGNALGVRARRRDPLRVGADAGENPRTGGREGDAGFVRPVSGRAARCDGDLFAARPGLSGPEQGPGRVSDDRDDRWRGPGKDARVRPSVAFLAG